MKRLSFFLVVAITGIGMLLYIRSPCATPVMRGYKVASRLGCFGCHGPGGARGALNPNSITGEIPPFNAGGPIMFYVQNENDLRSWILNGERAPKPQPTSHIRMPPFKDNLSEEDLNDLIAYIKTVAYLEKPGDPEAEWGRKIATRVGCFGCHGAGGREAVSNPGSFKGIIPPWDGRDFWELVKNDAELEEWILEGKIGRFESNPLARFFTRRQTIKMPAYKNILTSRDVKRIKAYIHWLRNPERKTAQYWTAPSARLSSAVERGRWLFQQSGCATCHGVGGQGGVPNPHTFDKFVPSLEDLAEKLGLHRKKDAETVVSLIESGVGPEKAGEIKAVPHHKLFLTKYQKAFNVIVKGSKPLKKEDKDPEPPMQMPAWKNRLHGDSGPISKNDVHSVIAYLLTLQPWEE